MKDAEIRSATEFMAGGGEMGEMMRNKDWSQTQLGEPSTWPNTLKTLVQVMLSNPFAMSVLWGPEFIQLYNDGYKPIFGKNKHPKALGISKKESYPEIWHIIGPHMEAALAGKGVSFSDLLLPLNRNGYLEDCYFNFSYSPIPDDSGKPGGVLVTVVETTGKKRTEENLRESEERFRTMAESTDVFIAVGDETSNAVYFNKAWVELTGRPMEELLEYGWLDLVHPEDRDNYLRIYQEAFIKRERFTGEFRIKNNRGEYRWMLASGPPRFRHDGSFAGYISSCVDITERKEIEKQLLEKEHLLESVINSAPFPIGVYKGREMIVELANQDIKNTWGKGNKIEGRSYMDILPELKDTGIYNQLQKVYDTGEPFHAKNQRVDLVVDGTLEQFYFNYSFTPLYDISGKIYGVMNTAANVTDIALANIKVKESEKSLRQTILQAPVAMCILKGRSFVVELANERMYELWGKSSAEMEGRPLLTGLPEIKDQGFDKLLEEVYTTGKAFVAEGVPVDLPRQGGMETLYVNFVYEAYKESEGDISGILVVAVDVTAEVIARQKIEEVVEKRTKELADANKSLQKSNSELAQFAYIASHDLQEPLRKISNFTQMLEKRIRDNIDEQSRNYLIKINNSSARMHTLIRDVLTYSELVKEADSFEMVDLAQVFENTLTDYELLVEQKQAEIYYSDLPQIEAIPLQMSQLFGNMLSNSLKFSRKDQVPKIEVAAMQVSDNEKQRLGLNQQINYTRICFSDNGIGFREEHAEKIFNIFQRLHRKSEYEGTGIGLAMCKKIALNHGGDLNAEGTSENGAVFNIYLPVTQKKKDS